MLASIGIYSAKRRVTFRTAITFNQPASDLTNFPVLFSSTLSYLKSTSNGGGVVNPNGYDIAFYSDSSLTNLLSFERIKWNSSTGQVIFWIKIPTLTSASATVIYLTYGNQSINSDLQNITDTWSNGFIGVYHLGDGTTLSAFNSATGTSGTINNSPAAFAGTFGGGATFNATNQYISQAMTGSPLGTFSWGAWCTPAALTVGSSIVGSDGTAQPLFQMSGSGAFQWQNENAITSVTPSVGVRVHLAGTNTGSVVIYTNGTATGSSGVATQSLGTLNIGRRGDGVAVTYFNGSIEEVRVANVIRTATWIATEYSNQSNPSAFYTLT